MGAGFLSAVAAGYTCSILTSGPDEQGRVPPDTTRVTVALDGDHEAVLVVVSAPELKRLVAARSSSLDHLIEDLRRVAHRNVDHLVAPIFTAAATTRVSLFADYYFSNMTTMYMLKEALTVAAAHQVGETESSTREAVALHLEKLLLAKYESIVLRPELNNTPIKHAFNTAANSTREAFAKHVEAIDSELNELLSRPGTASDPLLPTRKPQGRTELNLDWTSHSRKVEHWRTRVEQRCASVGMPALTTSGAVVGTLDEATVAKSITTLFASKLAAPFVAKSAVATHGACTCGPETAVVKAVAGVPVDASLAVLHGLLNREEFLREVNDALDASKQHCALTMIVELENAIQEWVDGAKQSCVL